MPPDPNAVVADLLWRYRYRLDTGPRPDADCAATWRRVADALATVEERDRAGWSARFRAILDSGEFLPAGRIIANAGSGRQLALLNCFVMGRIEDSVAGVYASLAQGATTLQMGGGVGYDFSTLPPHGTRAPFTATEAAGPAGFLPLWNDTAEIMVGHGARRGAMLISLRCDHPDVLAFVNAKRDGSLSRLNLSVQVTDAFAAAVRDAGPWPLAFGDGGTAGAAPASAARPAAAALPARELWRAIASAAHACGEPGLLFVDRINRENNLGDVETLTTTNPCAEAPLPPYGACCLGSVNVLKFVRAPYGANAHLDLERIDAVVSTAVRLLDNVLDCTLYPLPEQRATALATRRIGLGITGLADALTMLGLRYGTAAALECATALLRRIRDAAYAASCALAREKGSFPSLRPAAYLDRPFISRLPAALRDEIRRHGVRNSHLLAIAPAGSISLLAGNVSSGIEPPAGERYQLTLSFGPSAGTPLPVENLACQEWRAGGRAGLPPAFIAAAQVPPQAQLALQSELQRYVDGAISKTVALPRSAAVGAVERLYTAALHSQVKGVTVFRRGAQRAPMECSVNDCT